LLYSSEQKEYKDFTVTVLLRESSIPRSCSHYRFRMVKGKFEMGLEIHGCFLTDLCNVNAIVFSN